MTKLFHFSKGYVIIEVSGSDLERFLNICVRRNIRILDAERISEKAITLCIRAADFYKLRPVARKTKSKVHIISKPRLYYIRRNRHKYIGFCLGLVFLVLFLLLLHSIYGQWKLTEFITPITMKLPPFWQIAEYIPAQVKRI